MSIELILSIGIPLITFFIGYGVLNQRVASNEKILENHIIDTKTVVKEVNGAYKNLETVVENKYGQTMSSIRDMEGKIFLSIENMRLSNQDVLVNMAKLGERIEHMNNNLKTAENLRHHLNGRDSK